MSKQHVTNLYQRLTGSVKSILVCVDVTYFTNVLGRCQRKRCRTSWKYKIWTEGLDSDRCLDTRGRTMRSLSDKQAREVDAWWESDHRLKGVQICRSCKRRKSTLFIICSQGFFSLVALDTIGLRRELSHEMLAFLASCAVILWFVDEDQISKYIQPRSRDVKQL